MITDDGQIKCDECGRYIGYNDLYNGTASHHCILEDTEFSRETFESFCARCYPNEKRRRNASRTIGTGWI